MHSMTWPLRTPTDCAPMSKVATSRPPLAGVACHAAWHHDEGDDGLAVAVRGLEFAIAAARRCRHRVTPAGLRDEAGPRLPGGQRQHLAGRLHRQLAGARDQRAVVDEE